MQGTLTPLLTLAIMVIGLALIVGGFPAVQFLFAPFLSGIRQVAQWLFVALIVLTLVAVALSGKGSAPKQACSSSSATPQSEIREVGGGATARAR